MQPRYHNSYLVLAPLQFWAMGPLGDRDEPRERTVINCALAEPDELAYDEMSSVNQIGAWSDLSTRLCGLLQASSDFRAPGYQLIDIGSGEHVVDLQLRVPRIEMRWDLLRPAGEGDVDEAQFGHLVEELLAQGLVVFA